MSFCYIPVASELMAGEEALFRAAGEYFSLLDSLGGKRLSKEQTDCDEPLFYFLITGGSESAAMQLKAARSKHKPDEPFWLIAHPNFNSLPASLEVLAKMQQDNIPGRIFYFKNSSDKETAGLINRSVQLQTARGEMQKARIGLVGTPSDWLVASSPLPETVKKQWGPEVVKVSLNELKQAISEVKDNEITELKNTLTSKAIEIKEPSSEEIDDVVKVYIALKRVTEKYNLSSLSVRCFDLVTDLKTTGCFALASLSDEGIMAGCEGDLNSTLGLLLVKKLLNKTAWMANPAQLDEKQNRLWLAHCTVPLTMIEDYRLRSHFESGLGLGIQGTLPTGPVTLLRIGGKNLDQVWAAEGNMINAGYSDLLCRTQAEIELTGGGTVKDLLERPLGNHLIMFYGHHLDDIQNYM